jgi:hypothetical protein
MSHPPIAGDFVESARPVWSDFLHNPKMRGQKSLHNRESLLTTIAETSVTAPGCRYSTPLAKAPKQPAENFKAFKSSKIDAD